MDIKIKTDSETEYSYLEGNQCFFSITSSTKGEMLNILMHVKGDSPCKFKIYPEDLDTFIDFLLAYKNLSSNIKKTKNQIRD